MDMDCELTIGELKEILNTEKNNYIITVPADCFHVLEEASDSNGN